MRLNKYISHYSTYSRREADRAIFDGYVRVNGEIETNPATQIDEKNDEVRVSGKKILPSSMFTVIVYSKPRGELVTKSDPRGRRTIYESLGKEFRHFIPVGRLDYASEGLLLLSDSPKVVTALMNSKMERIYKLKIKGPVTDAMIAAMEGGLELEDASAGAHHLSELKSMSFAPFFAYQIQKNEPTFSILKVAIGEGQNRELRRFFGHFNAEVVDLKRLSFGGIELNNLPSGKSRYLERNEYASLREFISEIDKKSKPKKSTKGRKSRENS